MINKLPALSDPVKYTGLYIFDFGERVSVGYTAQEIEILLAESKYAGGGVYKIYRAFPDGKLEIRGVNPLTWSVSTGIVFWFEDYEETVKAFELLKVTALDSAEGLPGEFSLAIIRTPGLEYPFALIMRYLQELDEAIAAWLLKVKFQAGAFVEAGPRVITRVLTNSTELVCERLGADTFRKSRTREQVLDSVDLDIQR
jgi:hypothetical protein